MLTNSNDSSQASTRSTIAGGSPRTVQGPPSGQSGTPQHLSAQSEGGQQNNVQVLSNPLDTIPEPAYQTVHQPLGQEHIYHSLDDNEGLPRNLNTCNTLGKLDVMLPNGQMVPATLVRNVSGRIVPLVEVDSKNINISPDPAVRTSRRSNNSNRHFL